MTRGKIKIEEYKTTCMGKIRASCYGLIILNNGMKEEGGLIVMNPVTRELSALPLATLFPRDESYGLGYCKNTGKLKLVQLFRDELNFIGCEILILGDNSWKMVDRPAFGLLGWFGYDPIFAIGAIRWDDNKFWVIPLPKCCGALDRIVEMGGNLGFVDAHEVLNQIDVWILRDLLDGEGWTKEFSINEGIVYGMWALCCSRISSEIIFKDNYGQLYAYDCGLQLMRKVEKNQVKFLYDHHFLLPHVNSLISWKMPVDVVD
ncbi:hypothetical protein M9H77_18017 [Catharanthus roseus]|uniref:Uncharacterized protein n=1 Tax=Catharanthus roseus TaxID=4058 RepID=A0ACC0B692_CATRO|nr:hypothetical protein M9H77_18017 [Catharanthus roseus]